MDDGRLGRRLSLLCTYVLTDGGAIMGSQMAFTSAAIAGLLVFFSWYSWFMSVRGVLRYREIKEPWRGVGFFTCLAYRSA